MMNTPAGYSCRDYSSEKTMCSQARLTIRCIIRSRHIRSAGVGAVSDRPRAINNRPYGFYCSIFAFYNMHLLYNN